MTIVHIDKILENLKSIEDINSDYALAKVLKVNPGNISKWRKRGTIPYPELLEYCEKRGIILNAILTGEGRIHKQRTEFTDEIIKKIMEKENLSTVSQVAKILNTTQYQLGLWINSRYIPIQILENYCLDYRLNIDWLMETAEYSELIELRSDLMTAEEKVEYRKAQLEETTKELFDLKATLKKVINN